MRHAVRYTAEKIAQRLQLITPLIYRRHRPLPAFYYRPLSGPLEPPPLTESVDDTWTVLNPDSHWGQPRTDFILRTEFEVPDAWEESLPVALHLPLGEAGDFSHPEALIYLDGQAYAACDRHHQEVRLGDAWRDGAPHQLALHGWTGRNRDDRPLFMRTCSVVQIDPETRDFVALARVSLGVAQHLDANEPAKGHLLNALEAAFKVLETKEPLGEGFYESLPEARARLEAGVQKAGPSLGVDITAVGHAHIDVAWLWTLGQTRRKAGRTFHTVLRLMEEFPDYRFTQSQPQLYDYVRQDHPELFEAIKARVVEGRWETVGGMWVEADCNLSGSESLARQLVLGRAFFREHFGKAAESPVLWLPDVFGYAWNLPQLIKQAGLEYFFTIKIGWSQYNRLPYDSFWWRGLDGTEVLTHFSTAPEIGSPHASTYNAAVTPEQVLGTWRNFQQKESQQELFMAFGHGDGGGGPTREMLENIREMRDFPATPRLTHGTARAFFERLEATSGETLPVWNGELYLELHRGTYTTQSRNKRANRKSEFRLHDAEFLASYALTLAENYAYPAEDLRRAWELVCLNQFHDIIPGSSIGPVYEESLAQYEEVRALAAGVCEEALGVIARSIGGDVTVVNPTSFVRDDLAFLSGELPAGMTLRRADGEPVVTQATEGGTLLAVGPLPPYSVTRLELTDSEPAEASAEVLWTELRVTSGLLENAYLRVELDEAGDITRVFDKGRQREVVPPGAVANQFQAFEDRPLNWDAWDIDIFYDDKVYVAGPAQSVRVVEEGPLRVTLEVTRQILGSPFTQRLSLPFNSPRLDIDTEIDWRERHILLKVAFPVEVLAPVATHEIQWGSVQRPTHRNTSWDWARFETCAQKWVDLSESDYGVSLLNDCKYGHDVQGKVLRMSLLRSPTRPDPEADSGTHRFTYSLLPHEGAVGEATVAAAYALNDPLIAARGEAPGRADGADARSFLAVDQPNVIIETVKRAEDGNGIVVRLYESGRRRGPVVLTVGFPLAGAWRTDLLEERGEALEHHEGTVTFPIKPFEIVTLRLVPAREVPA